MSVKELTKAYRIRGIFDVVVVFVFSLVSAFKIARRQDYLLDFSGSSIFLTSRIGRCNPTKAPRL
jgi:hypothetical protein